MRQASVVQPSLTVLTADQVAQVHDYSLHILETVGVRVDSQRARQLFAQKIGPAPGDDRRVRIPRRLVEWALQAAPRTVDIDESSFGPVLDMLEGLHGDLAARPFVLPYFNPISPLVINEGTADKMLLAIERGLPFLYSNYGMAGASTPITPAGALTLLNAELLAGLVLSQLVKEGTPLILGSLPAYFDMKGMGSFYDVQSYLVDLACAEMMAHYGLPHCGTSGSGMGWGADLIAAGHQEMVQAGPGGSFLMSGMTLRRFRQAYHHSAFFPKLTLEDWQAGGCPRAGDALRQYTQQLLGQLEPPGDHDELMARGKAFIQALADR
jgi:trimethylamine:corrinoid methyltransferase-like protein